MGNHSTATRQRSVRHLARTATALAAGGALLLSGCSAGGGTPEDGETITVLVVKSGLTKPMKDIEWVDQLEKQAEVKIKWQEIAADWDQKKATLLASGDVPDLIIGSNVITDSELSKYGSLFEDLGEHMDELPNVRDMFGEVEGAEQMATQEDGAVYAIPSWYEYWPQASVRQYINQEWLDNLGLDMPRDWDELYDVLVQFEEKDANGNGDSDDEIPMDWAPVPTWGFGYFNPMELLSSVGIVTSNGGGQGTYVQDGEVKNFLVSDGYRQTLEFLSKAWAAGLINPDNFTQDYAAYQAIGRGDGDDARVGFSWGWTASDRFGAALDDQYVSMAPIPRKLGQREPVVWGWDFYNLNPNHILMSKKTTNKDAALRAINEFYSQDMSVQTLWGTLGKDVEKIDDTTYEVLPPADPETDSSTWKWQETLGDAAPTWIRGGLDVTLPQDLDEAVVESEPLQDALAAVNPATDTFPQYIKVPQADRDQIALNNTTVMNVAMSAFADFITNGDIEGKWDAYVSQLEKSGLTQNVDLLQKAYDAGLGG